MQRNVKEMQMSQDTNQEVIREEREKKSCVPHVLIACQQVLLFHLILESLLELSNLTLLPLNLSSQPLSGLSL